MVWKAMNKIIEPNPEMAAVLMTYQCVAQCDESVVFLADLIYKERL